MEYWEQLQEIRKKIKEINGVIRIWKEGNVYRIRVQQENVEAVKNNINRNFEKELSFNHETEKYGDMKYLYYNIIMPKTGIDLEIEQLEQKLKEAKQRKKEILKKKQLEEKRKQLEKELMELKKKEEAE